MVRARWHLNNGTKVPRFGTQSYQWSNNCKGAIEDAHAALHVGHWTLIIHSYGCYFHAWRLWLRVRTAQVRTMTAHPYSASRLPSMRNRSYKFPLACAKRDCQECGEKAAAEATGDQQRRQRTSMHVEAILAPRPGKQRGDVQ